jgi:phytoene synthase
MKAAWIPRIRAIRLADRLAENQQLDPTSRRFDAAVEVPDVFASEPPAVRAAWRRYLCALRTYHRQDLRLRTVAEHRTMLDDLSGSLFQLVPFLSPRQSEAIRGLGALDQFFNNLRDLAEDAANGICYFPHDVLARVGLSRDDVLGERWRSGPGWPQLMRFWLDEYLPELERRAAAFIACDDLHPSVARLRSECRTRHLRILSRFRAVEFEFRRFAEEYWAEVRERAANFSP